MAEQKIKIVEKILDANDRLANANRQRFDDAGVYAINLMASPGAGKTSFILKTIRWSAVRRCSDGCDRRRYSAGHHRRG